MIDNTDLTKLYELLNVASINPSRNYWLVRTEGGSYFDDFVIGQFIALAYNKITQKTLDTSYDRPQPIETLKEIIINRYPDNSRPGLTASYINTFYRLMKKGDIVAIPSYGSREIQFGELMEDSIYFEQEETISSLESTLESGRSICPYYMRRKVKWLKSFSRDKLDLKFFKALFTHNAICDLNDYSSVIDRMMNEVFIKNGELHYKLNITTQDSISLSTYLELSSSIAEICDDFNDFGDHNIRCRFDDISVKIQAESAGFMEFISSNSDSVKAVGDIIATNVGFVPTILIVALVGVFIMGGEIGFIGIKFQTPGLSTKILEWVKYLKESKPKSVEKFKSTVETLNTTKEQDGVKELEENSTSKEKEDV